MALDGHTLQPIENVLRQPQIKSTIDTKEKRDTMAQHDAMAQQLSTVLQVNAIATGAKGGPACTVCPCPTYACNAPSLANSSLSCKIPCVRQGMVICFSLDRYMRHNHL
jgi:hypothetical protein